MTSTEGTAPTIELLEICPVVGDQTGPCSPATLALRGLGQIAAQAEDAPQAEFQDGVRVLPAAVDTETPLVVHATSAPPQMFREGIGVVVEGTMTKDGSFAADKAASNALLPDSRSTFANSTIRMAVLVESPISSTIPTWA